MGEQGNVDSDQKMSSSKDTHSLKLVFNTHRKKE